MSALDTDPMDALASALNAIDPTANASAKTMGEAEMLARVHNVVVGGTVSHLTTPVGQLLAGIANALSNGPAVSHLTHSRTEMVAAMAGQSALTVSEGDLWASAMTAVAGYSGGGGGGGDYLTGAVAFDGATYLANLGLAATDNAYASVSLWFNCSNLADTNAGYLFVADPGDQYVSYAYLPGSDGTGGSVELGSAAGYSSLGFDAAQGGWRHILASVDASGTPIGALYVDGSLVSTGTPTGAGGSMLWNALSLYIGTDASGPEAPVKNTAMADIWIAPGQSLLVDGAIPPSTIAKFISGGKPVDLGADGSTPTGVAPAVFLRRAPAAAASTFATNLGSGGDFTITGALTSAASSPSD